MVYTDKILYQSNYWYNDGLGKAQIRDLSGAIVSLRKSLQYNRENVAARNLLGLVYYGRGEVAEALVEWILSKNLQPRDNIANYYISQIQKAQSELENINQAVKKFNQCLIYCEQGAEDLAIIQLKKVVAMHPAFLKAYQLMALLYIHTEQYREAKRVLRIAHKLDTTNEVTLRYVHEITNDKIKNSKEVKGTASDSVTYKLGNETIIQPTSTAFKGEAKRIALTYLLVGLAAGAAFVWFLIMPAVERANARAVNEQIIEFSEQIEAQEAQISAQTKALDEYREVSEATEEAAATASSTKQSYELLMLVQKQYDSRDYSNATMVGNLLQINRASLGESGQATYDRITGDIYPTYCQKQYKKAMNAMEVANYTDAITILDEIVKINEAYSDGGALLNLGMAYQGQGDTEKAYEYYNRLIKLLPESNSAGQAREQMNTSSNEDGTESADNTEE